MSLTEVYVGLGGNLGDSVAILNNALLNIGMIEGVRDLNPSRFYLTTPVSEIEQNPYVNAVCKFYTTLKPKELLTHLQQIEQTLGKKPKAKNAPRVIDLDILFFGQENSQSCDLEIPHPKWMERLFVLIPLADLTPSISIPDPHVDNCISILDIKQLIQAFSNINNEHCEAL